MIKNARRVLTSYCNEEHGMEVILWVIPGIVLIWFIITLDKINDNLRDIKKLLEEQQRKDDRDS